jgi:hypothetical protein
VQSRVGRPEPCRTALHRAGQTHAERLHRELNGRLRDEFLNETLFTSLAQARVALGCWRTDYNHARPHSQLGWRTPVRVRHDLPPAPGSGAALCRRLRASSRRSHRPIGQIQRQGQPQNWINLGARSGRHASPPAGKRVGSTDCSPARLAIKPGPARQATTGRWELTGPPEYCRPPDRRSSLTRRPLAQPSSALLVARPSPSGQRHRGRLLKPHPQCRRGHEVDGARPQS